MSLLRKALDGRAMVIVVSLCFLWGMNQVAVKVANLGVSPIFQAALRLRAGPEAHAPGPVDRILGEGEELCHIAGDLEARRPAEAAARAAAYLAQRYSPERFFDVLANYAARDSPLASDGWNLLMADVCAAEHVATRAAEPAQALAAFVAASPADWTAYKAWAPVLGP